MGWRVVDRSVGAPSPDKSRLLDFVDSFFATDLQREAVAPEPYGQRGFNKARASLVRHDIELKLLPKLFSHLWQEAALFEVSHGAGHNQLLQINFLDLGIDSRDEAPNEFPDLGIGSNIQTRHLLARDFIRRLN